MAGNYPDGVTGNEFYLAGPDSVTSELLTCPGCDNEVEVEVVCFDRQCWTECEQCGERWNVEFEVDVDPPEPDDGHNYDWGW